MSTEKRREQFLQIAENYIHRDGIDRLLAWLDKTDFFIAPASTKFHGNYPGGLCEHSINVYEQLMALIHMYYPGDEITEELKESAAVSALFHDLCKANFYTSYMKNVKNDETGRWEKVMAYKIEEKVPLGHSQKSVIILQQFMKLNLDEIYAIMAHMGGFDTSVKGGEYYVGTIFGKSKLALLLHMADLVASNLMEVTSNDV